MSSTNQAVKSGPRVKAARRKSRPRLLTMLAAAYVGLIVVAAIFAPYLAPYGPNDQDIFNTFASPGGAHLLGTDEVGRDVLSRLIFGARISLIAGLQGVLIAGVFGIGFGVVAGYVGGKFDSVSNTINDNIMSLPGLILAIAFVAVLGPGITNAMIAIGIVFIPRFFRVSRAATMSVRELTFIEGLRALGCTHTRILGRHVIPNILGPLIVEFTVVLSASVLAEASLSFLGLAAQPPTASWGAMLNTAQFHPSFEHLIYPPGIVLALFILSLTLLGDVFADRAAIGRRGGAS